MNNSAQYCSPHIDYFFIFRARRKNARDTHGHGSPQNRYQPRSVEGGRAHDPAAAGRIRYHRVTRTDGCGVSHSAWNRLKRQKITLKTNIKKKSKPERFFVNRNSSFARVLDFDVCAAPNPPPGFRNRYGNNFQLSSFTPSFSSRLSRPKRT